jgi:hypothetical protein
MIELITYILVSAAVGAGAGYMFGSRRRRDQSEPQQRRVQDDRDDQDNRRLSD